MTDRKEVRSSTASVAGATARAATLVGFVCVITAIVRFATSAFGVWPATGYAVALATAGLLYSRVLGIPLAALFSPKEGGVRGFWAYLGDAGLIASNIGLCYGYAAVVGAVAGRVPLLQESGRWLEVGAGLLVSVVLIPVAEEFYFRGLLLRELGVMYGRFVSVVTGAIWFGAVHSAPSIPVALCVGIVCGILYYRTRSLALPILAHAATNLALLAGT